MMLMYVMRFVVVSKVSTDFGDETTQGHLCRICRDYGTRSLELLALKALDIANQEQRIHSS